MKVCFIKEKYTNFDFFRRIDIEHNGEDLICTVPMNKKTNKIPINIKRLINYLYSNCISTAVLSEKLFEIEMIRNYFYANSITILDGKILFKHMANNLVSLIFEYLNKKMSNSECTICLNNMSNYSAKQIIELATKLKRLNIISNNQKQFEKIEEYLYNELGIMIKVSNNKNQDLLKSQVILNVDFSEELLNEYRLPNKCAIINVIYDVEIKKKQFSGININSFNVEIPDDKKIANFKNEHILEAMLCKNAILPKAEVVDLIGKNGVIDKKEIISMFA